MVVVAPISTVERLYISAFKLSLDIRKEVLYKN